MKGKETKEGKHHRAQATQTHGRVIVTEKPRKRAGRRQRGMVENKTKRHLPLAAATRLKEGATRLLCQPHLFSVPFPLLTHSFHPSINSLQHTSTHPSFLQHCYISSAPLSVCLHSSRFPFSTPPHPSTSTQEVRRTVTNPSSCNAIVNLRARM